ncbi:hypothetical protein HY838_00390 [Candidatus Azambacteria bacterium]|nr:hypothetical protein [Candidatus Azambacteria bacterium]
MDQIIQSNKIKNILIYIVIAAVALAMGYYFGSIVGKNKIAQESCQTMLKEVFSGVDFANNLSGNILEISSDQKSLIIDVPRVLSVNLPKEYRQKKVLLSDNAKIFLIEKKELAVFDKEMKEFLEKQKSIKNISGLFPPVPSTEKEIKVGDLKIGDSVNVSFSFGPGASANPLDAQFTAVRINIYR